MNVDIAVTEFLVYLQAAARAARTVGVYRQRLRVLVERFETVEGIHSRQLEQIVAEWRGRNLAAASLAGYIQALKTFFAWCVRRGYLEASPAVGLVKPDLRGKRKPKAMRQEDLIALIDLAAARGLLLEQAMLMMLADTGCRIGELLALDVADLDVGHCEAATLGKCGQVELDYTEATADLLRAWLAVRPATDARALWTNPGGRVKYSWIYQRLERLGRELGLTRWNPHAIRHRVGQGWIDQGANLEVVRQKLHHRDISTTAMIYGNQDRARIKAASRKYSLVKGR